MVCVYLTLTEGRDFIVLSQAYRAVARDDEARVTQSSAAMLLEEGQGYWRTGVMVKLWWSHARYVPARLAIRVLFEAGCLSS